VREAIDLAMREASSIWKVDVDRSSVAVGVKVPIDVDGRHAVRVQLAERLRIVVENGLATLVLYVMDLQFNRSGRIGNHHHRTFQDRVGNGETESLCVLEIDRVAECGQ